MSGNTLGDEYPKEQARCREVLRQYQQTQELCPQANCHFAIASIKADLKEADEAALSCDLVRMIAAFKAMKDIE